MHLVKKLLDFVNSVFLKMSLALLLINARSSELAEVLT